MTKFLLIFICALGCPAGAAQKSYGNVTVTEVTTIYDGDTFTASIQEWPPIIGHRISIRINGIDTPEMRGKCRHEIELAREAKKATVAMLRAAKKIELRDMSRDKYFRIGADVYVDGKSIGEELLRSGLAVQYNGGKKTKWCFEP